MRKTIVNGLLTIIFLTAALPFLKAETFVSGGVSYSITSAEEPAVEVVSPETSGYNPYSGSISIPASVEYEGETYAVTAIADYAFYWCTGLEEIKLSDGIERIGDYAFYDCYSLTSVSLGNTVKTIGDEAFACCYRLSSIRLPSALESMGYAVFHESTKLENIEVDEDCEAFCSDDYGVLYNKDKTSLIQFPAASEQISYTIPDSVVRIEDYAFYWCDALKEINIGASVSEIGVSAFYYCENLQSLTLPESLVYIGEEAFYYCRSLEEAVIPDNVTALGDGAFSACKGLLSVKIGNSVAAIGAETFGWCESLKSVEIGASVETIGDGAFYYCPAMERYDVSEGNMNYSSDDFGVLFNKNKTSLIQYPVGSSLYSYSIPATVNTLEESSFYSSAYLTAVNIPSSVTSIGYQTFCGCKSLKAAILPSSLVRIEQSVFWECTALETVEIPASVTSIGDYAFAYCSALANITSLNPEPPVCEDTDVFFDVDKDNCLLTVPTDARDAYAVADVWSEFANIAETDPTGVKSVISDGGKRTANRFSTDGKRLTSPCKGVDILRYSDGTVRKVLVK